MNPGCSLSLLRIQIQFSFISGCHVVLAAAQVQSGSRKGAGSLQFLSLKKNELPQHEHSRMEFWRTPEVFLTVAASLE